MKPIIRSGTLLIMFIVYKLFYYTSMGVLDVNSVGTAGIDHGGMSPCIDLTFSFVKENLKRVDH